MEAMSSKTSLRSSSTLRSPREQSIRMARPREPIAFVHVLRLPTVCPPPVDPRALDGTREHELRSRNMSEIKPLDQKCCAITTLADITQKSSIPVARSSLRSPPHAEAVHRSANARRWTHPSYGWQATRSIDEPTWRRSRRISGGAGKSSPTAGKIPTSLQRICWNCPSDRAARSLLTGTGRI